jgi:adenine-specific DNA-methyltransferase
MSKIKKFPLSSLGIKDQQLDKLKELFPEVFTEGSKVDWDKLRLTLGETIDMGKERFGMNWPGKADCFKTIQQPSLATLVPAREESVDFEKTENLFIEGDNLEVLKLLQKSYLGKIKMIYIDPPYNTGNDFIYPDNYSESLESYLEYTGQVDSEGKKFSTNSDTDGRFHSKWMNMMYPRLFLAKNLLKEDGVIFISIDDNELDNLKKICNDIIGEENFISILVWKKRVSPANDSKWFSSDHEYLIVYAKNKELWFPYRLERNERQNAYYKNTDNDIRGDWNSAAYTCNKSKEERPNLYYPIINPNTGEELWPKDTAVWAYSKDVYEQHVRDGLLYWGLDGKSKSPRKKQFISEAQPVVPRSFLDFSEAGSTQQATLDFLKLFDYNYFQYTKPTLLIIRLLNLATKNNAKDIVLDFFAGSCTTANAVLELNKQDNGNRKFICVQLPEITDENSEAFKAGYKSIADIGKERIRRVIKKLSSEAEQKTEKDKINPKLFKNQEIQTNENSDLGFKVFKLAKSNFSLWNADVNKAPEAIQQQLSLHVQHISPEAEQEAILFELLLKSGIPITTTIKTISLPADKGKKAGVIFSIDDNELIICLEKQLTHELIKGIAELKPQRVICLDEGFQNNDQLKTNAALIMKSNGVVKFQTV